MSEVKEERIAKLIARAGICSRRDAERLLANGRVTYKGEIIDNPALKFPNTNDIKVDGESIGISTSRLWMYHKPVGLIVSHYDDQGRETIFDDLPIKERVVSVGRLDKNTSGLLLLTNDGELARELELPSNNFKRVYMVRVYGYINFPKLKEALSKPLTIEGVTYRPVEIDLEDSGGSNTWIRLTITEGKNREIRNILNFFELRINRLVRIQYGPFELGNLELEEVQEISSDY
jgi:23S rRNA pseudouridine2605 synthase